MYFNIEETGTDDNIVLIHKETERRFNLFISKKDKFIEHGFAKFNKQMLVYDRVRAFDFAFIIGKTNLTIKITVENVVIRKTIDVDIVCDEIVPGSEDIMKCLQDFPASQNLIQLMLNKINNLEGKVEELTRELQDLRETEEFRQLRGF